MVCSPLLPARFPLERAASPRIVSSRVQRSTDSAPIVGREPIPFGKYLLLERISVGGMAEVFKAKTFGVGGFEKVVAVKRILPSLADDA